MSEASDMQDWECIDQLDEPVMTEWQKVLEHFGYEESDQLSNKQRENMLWNYRKFVK